MNTLKLKKFRTENGNQKPYFDQPTHRPTTTGQDRQERPSCSPTVRQQNLVRQGKLASLHRSARAKQLSQSTRPTALNSEDPRGLRCSTQPIHERHDVPRPDADGWCGTKLTSTERYHLNLSRLQCSGASSRAAIMKDYEPAKLRFKLRDAHPSVHGVQQTNTDCSTTHTPFACTEFFCGSRNVEDRTMIKEAIKCKPQERL